MPARLLVAPATFSDALSADAVAAAVGRGIERAGLEPPELCPVAGGGHGTLAVLAAALGGPAGGSCPDTPGLVLVEDGATAIVEPAAARVPAAASALPAPGASRSAPSRTAGELIAAAAEAGARTILVACGAEPAPDDGAGTVEAVRERGGLRGARLVALCDVRPAVRAPGGLAGALHEALGARLEAGASHVLDALGFDARMRAAGAVIAGDARLDETTLLGAVAGEIAVRARQAGVPCHAVCAVNALAPFDQRILDIQRVVEATSAEELEEAGAFLATHL